MTDQIPEQEQPPSGETKSLLAIQRAAAVAGLCQAQKLRFFRNQTGKLLDKLVAGKEEGNTLGLLRKHEGMPGFFLGQIISGDLSRAQAKTAVLVELVEPASLFGKEQVDASLLPSEDFEWAELAHDILSDRFDDHNDARIALACASLALAGTPALVTPKHLASLTRISPKACEKSMQKLLR